MTVGATVRVIAYCTIFQSFEELKLPDAVHVDALSREALTELVTQDRMPLLSLLQASPLRVQAAHLSFQEFFAARAVCNGRRERGTQMRTLPWQLPAWWSNAVRLGVEMGDAFGKGMLEAAGDFAGGLDNAAGGSVRVPGVVGDLQTSALAVCAALRAVPRHELWYDDVASNCTQAALALVGFLEAHGVAQTRKLSFACNQFHATRAPVEARMNSDDIAQVRALLAQEEAR